MMLKILKCLKEGMSENRNVKMPPHTSAQYLHLQNLPDKLMMYPYTLP